MITAYVFAEGMLKKSILSGSPNLASRDAQAPADLLPTHVRAVAEHAAEELSTSSVWVDLCDPTPAEIASVERVFGIETPTREEMLEIEASSRLYTENGFLVMTAPILHRASAEIPESGTVTFILLPGTLVTMRFVDPLPFAVFARRAERNPGMASSAQAVLLGLLESITDRLADVLELAQADMERVSRDIFATRAAALGGQAEQGRPRLPGTHVSDQVGLAHDPRRPAVLVDDQQGAHARRDEALRRLEDRLVGGDRQDAPGHHVSRAHRLLPS